MAEQPGISVFTPPKAPAASAQPAAPVVRESHVRSAAVAEGTRSNPAITPAQALWKADFDANTRADPWRDPNVVITKDPDGTIRTRPRNGTGQQPGARDAAAQPAEQQQTEVGPASTDGDKLKIGDFELSSDDIRGLMERKSLEDGRRANAPRDAADYSLDLPEDFQLPPGTAGWTWNLEDPTSAALLGQAKEFAFAHGLDKPAFSKLLGLYVSNQLAEANRFNELKKAEIGKLGANVSTRVDAVNTWLESQLGSDLAKSLRTSMHTAKSVEAYEKLMRNHSSQGVGGNPGASREGGYAAREPPRLSDEAYSRLSFHEKQQYAAQFDQSRLNGGR